MSRKVNKKLVEEISKLMKPLTPGPITLGEFNRLEVMTVLVMSLGVPVDMQTISQVTELKSKHIRPILQEFKDKGFITTDSHFLTGEEPLYRLSVDIPEEEINGPETSKKS